MLIWTLVPPHWADTAREWLGPYPWLVRLLNAHRVLFAVAAAWAAVRDPRHGALLSLLCCSLAVWCVLELKLGPVLGGLLAALAAAALIAKPWPNRMIAGRCLALAGMMIAVASAAGM